MTDLFFSIDQTVFISVLIEVNLSILVVNLNKFLPMIGVFITFVMLYCFVEVWKSTSKKGFISSRLEERSDFFDYKPFKVLIDC
jgi:hypothetical protein